MTYATTMPRPIVARHSCATAVCTTTRSRTWCPSGCPSGAWCEAARSSVGSLPTLVLQQGLPVLLGHHRPALHVLPRAGVDPTHQQGEQVKTFTEEDVSRTLKILGPTSADIAQSLLNKGVTG